MKKIITSCFILLFALSVSAQWTNKSYVHNGLTRQYRIYVPPMYNASNPATLILTLHGLGDNMTNFSGIGMNYIADTANIIVVVPQAIADPFAGTAWNSGAGFSGYYPNSGVDDVSFLSSLIDTVQANYAVNMQRVYCCGFSMGGFMTERLGCELTNRFTAIASVAGTFGNGLGACTPQRQIPVAHFHGTADGTVGFYTNNYGVNADSLVNFWVAYNQCNTTPTTFSFPDIASDGYTVDHFLYTSPLQTDVEFFKVNNAGHIWLTPSNDIFYTTEIWYFFNRHKTNTVSIQQQFSDKNNVLMFPNPSSDELKIAGLSTDAEYKITDVNGLTVREGKLIAGHVEVCDVRILSAGIYFVQVKTNDGISQVRKFIKN